MKIRNMQPADRHWWPAPPLPPSPSLLVEHPVRSGYPRRRRYRRASGRLDAKMRPALPHAEPKAVRVLPFLPRRCAVFVARGRWCGALAGQRRGDPVI
jgi:hypothetical protein